MVMIFFILLDILEDLKRIPGPKLLHCLTVKGKGFKQAEENQTVFHAPGKFDKNTGVILETRQNQELRQLTRKFSEKQSLNWRVIMTG